MPRSLWSRSEPGATFAPGSSGSRCPNVRSRSSSRRETTRGRPCLVLVGVGSQREVPLRGDEPRRSRGLSYAETAGDRGLRVELLSMWCVSTWGPTSVTEGLARCEEVLVRGAGSREIEAEVARTRAALEAMRGDIAKAREHYSEGKRSSTSSVDRWRVPSPSRRGGTSRCSRGTSAGPRSSHDPSTAGSWRRSSSLSRDHARHPGAFALRSGSVRGGRRAGPGDGAEGGRGHLAVRTSGDGSVPDRSRPEATIARRSAWRARPRDCSGTDALIDHGECLLDLAEVLRAAGDHDEAVEAARAALALYEQKENVVEGDRAKGSSRT